MNNLKYKILLVLFGISLVVSIYLSIIPTPIVCNNNAGCDIVQTSSYNYMFGIKNSYFGVPIFAFLIVLTLLHMKTPTKNTKLLIHLAVILGSLFSLYFLYIQKFILRAYCTYCLIADICVLISLGIIIWKWKE